MNERTQTQKHMVSRRSGIGTGTTSLLMIFTVLCFATLAMLSLSTAASSQRIQNRGMESSVALGKAKAEVAGQMATLDAMLADQWATLGEGAEYEAAVQAGFAQLGWSHDAEAGTLALSVAVDNHNELVTTLRLEAPGAQRRFTLVSQATRPIDGWEPGAEGGLWLPS